MSSNGGPGIVRIPATIYKGMFDREVQVTVKIDQERINLIVPIDSVEMSEPPNDEGVEGVLCAEIVEKTKDGLLIDLPGEVQGVSSRVTYTSV
jgi:hypothetical protein